MLSRTDTFVSSGGSRTRPTAGLKRRKKQTRPSSSAPQSKRQRLAAREYGSAATARDKSSTKQGRRGGGLKKTSLKAKKPRAAGTRSGANDSSPRRKGQQRPFSKPVVRFADKKKRTLKGAQFKGSVGKTVAGGARGGGVKRRPGGQVFRRRAKAS